VPLVDELFEITLPAILMKADMGVPPPATIRPLRIPPPSVATFKETVLLVSTRAP
jgi:hypothetical protein